ncbi:E3 ubiquitin-protein ligase HUWE1-like [Zonotrichia albicollis]|uniref:E3 ubiquitin-protein ligase HUWE1-like n=1 Tax=Zonotrichia albicollis TaxID=44394 RepID=UPI003D80B09A
MLFDERKFPYHLMLQKFLCSGGHNALFETFNWALSMGGKVPVGEGLEHPDLPDGTGEFLDAWLMLVEKMVNPSTVLESPMPCLPRPPRMDTPLQRPALPRGHQKGEKWGEKGGNGVWDGGDGV